MSFTRRALALCLSTSLAAAPCGAAGTAFAQPAPAQPNLPNIAQYQVPAHAEPHLSPAQMASLIRHHIKYVFVLYQENRSFDSYFGTFPGADGIYSQPADQTPGFTQPIMNTDGTMGTIQPFRIGPDQFAADTDDIDHSHPLTVAKMDIVDGQPKMDHYALTEEKKYSPTGNPSLKAKQFGELAMAYEDCDTVPLLWAYADRFTLMDHVFEDMSGPSTPGNLSIFAAQTGVTQWALHPAEGFKTASGPGAPAINDADPYWGSPRDPNGNKNVPVNPADFAGKHALEAPQLNQTYASLALTTAGGDIKSRTSHDEDAKTDLADVDDDIGFIQHLDHHKIAWRWFEEGYSSKPQPDNQGPTDASGLHASYIAHHNGPQYFGYVSNNPEMRADMHGLHAFFTAIKSNALPSEGGVFYVKGGYKNEFGMKPADPDPAVQKKFIGDDDHPAYSDSQISESLVARAVNAIAASKYWSQSAIIITWDDSEGDYDHVPPPILIHGPDGSPISDGPRVPMLVISPFARTHTVSHEIGNQASVVKFVDAVFALPPLATLPDEEKGRTLGESEFHQKNIGPLDAITPDVGNLFDAFDPARLDGRAKPLPASYASLPTNWVTTLPSQSGASCKALNITPTTPPTPSQIPADFNPRPKTNPSKTE